MRIVLLIIIVSISLYACSDKVKLKNNRTATNHFKYLSQTNSSYEHNVVAIFGRVFQDFKNGATPENIRAIYADELYFNDTLKIVYNIKDLEDYLVESASHVKSTSVEILDVVKGHDDYYIKWAMNMDLTVKGKQVHSYSIGMTQLRFNESGKIVFHQDYWDSSEAFLEHLPLIGSLIKSIKSKVQ